MDKVVPVLSGVVAATYWTTALLWTAAYYITIPLHYPAYYLLRLVAVILSPAWYVFKGIGSALGVAAALIAKLKVSKVTLRHAWLLHILFVLADHRVCTLTCPLSSSYTYL